jgi:hypothetical protein
VSNEINQGFNDCGSSIFFVTSDGTRSYWTKGLGGINAANTYVIAINNSDGSFYAFPQGTAPTGSNQSSAYTSVADYDATANQVNPATGIAVQQSGNDLFVSHGNLNLVRVFDKVQGNLLGSFTVTNPGPLHTTANGDVWVISNAATPVLLRYTFANGTATLDKTISGLVKPVGVGVSADDSLVLVTDGGSSQQIKAFNNTTGASVWTYGQLGGMAVNGPSVTTSDFDFTTHSSIAFQADNTFWVGDPGNSGRYLHFSINGNTLTYIEQIAYNQVSYWSTVDLTNATRVFNQFLEYSVNYALPLGGTNGSWTLAKNWAYGLPNDSTHNYFGSSNGFSSVVTLSNGRTYGLLNNLTTGNEDLFELPASGMARPTGYTFSNSPRIYPDGTLRFNMNSGTSLSFYSQPLTGFDAKNNPVWGSPALLATTALASTDPNTWVAFPERTEMTASGMVVDYDPYQGRTGYHLGGIPSGGTAWQWRSAPSTTSAYNGWYPQDGHFDIGNGVQYAGDYHMALGRNIVCGYHGEFWKSGQASQWLNFLDNGLMVGRFGTYESAGDDSSTDGFAGNAVSPVLVTGPDGNTYLYHNDESNHGGTIRWRINNWDEIAEMNAVATIGTTASLSTNTAGPTVTVTSPTAAATYLNGDNITLSAAVGGTGSSISSVQFFDGTTSLGTVTTAPYTLYYSGLSVGTHVITAQATGNGITTTSAPVTITIGGNGTSAPPPVPVSLSSGAQTSQSVSLSWTEPGVGTTSSTIGNIISFQLDTATDSNALTPSTVAGAPSYAADNFYLLGQSNTNGLVVASVLNSVGATVSNLGLNCQMGYNSGYNSLQTSSSSMVKLFSAGVSTEDSTGIGISISNIPYALYDLVVYSLPANVNSGPQTANLSVSDNSTSSTVQQSFTATQTGYSVATVAFGSNSSVSNMNTIVFQGLTSPSFELQGNNIESFQIVERPYDQGAPTSYSIERASGTSGNFAVVGTVSGSASSFTDTSNLSAGITYQYRIEAINSFGASAFSNTLSVTTPGAASTTPSNFGSWQSQYFTAAQLADSTVSGATADPYGSGVPNLLAYALQLNPATAQLTNVPTPAISNGHLTMTYFVPASITDVSYIPEVSTDLITWNSGAGYTQVISNVAGAGGNTITVQDTLPTTTQKRFMHLRVTQLP